MLFKIGDLVSRNSYNNDTVFKIVSLENDIYYLKGVDVRLYADSPGNDLKIVEESSCDSSEIDDELANKTSEIINLDRNSFFLFTWQNITY